VTGAADLTYRWAWALLDGFAAAGLRRVVVSPGARSTPLTLAALRHPGLAVEVVVDERSAAFFALGLAKAERGPVALVATSGSAVANWFPAVVEADLARVPLILLSADRPPELQDCGANQTMDQLGPFGCHVRKFHQLPPAEADTGWLAGLAARAMAASQATALAGPVHLNVPLREPLVPAELALVATAVAPRLLPCQTQATAETLGILAELMTGTGAIVCGPDDLGDNFRRAVTDLASRLRVPVFADVLSGLRYGAAAGSPVLAHPDQVARVAAQADWLLRFGGAPVSRAMGDWLARGRVQVVVADHSRPADPSATATHFVGADPASLCRSVGGSPSPSGWSDRFAELDRAAAIAAEQLCAGDRPFEGALVRRLVRALPAGTPLFLGNSLAIRATEWFSGRIITPLRPFGNRGVSGIDGNLSTAFGVAAACGPTVAVVGDLTFLHDLGALALGRRHPLTVLLLDNGGGGIFDHLAQAALPEFEQAWLTPPSLDPVAAARAFGLPCVSAAGTAEAVAAVAAGLERPGGSVVHVPIDRGHSLARCRALFTGSATS